MSTLGSMSHPLGARPNEVAGESLSISRPLFSNLFPFLSCLPELYLRSKLKALHCLFHITGRLIQG